MDYPKQLLKVHNRANTDKIAADIGSNERKFKQIIDIIYKEHPPLPQRASWVLSAVNAKYPKLLVPHLGLFVDTISQFKVDGIKRNMISVLAKHDIPEQLQGKLIDTCFKFMLSPTETVAVKVEAMQCIANLLPVYPDLITELKAVIHDQLPKTSAAFRARAKHVLKFASRH
ncbi:MAG TPA: hypothetical protein VFL70_04840 [Bacteroidia bacterium]|nr:hypothetical protein [Bacteroidia bacterium]